MIAHIGEQDLKLVKKLPHHVKLRIEAAAYEDEKATVEGSVTAIRGGVDCFAKARLVGTVFAGGVNESPRKD